MGNLYEAIKEGDLNEIKRYIQNGIDVKIYDNFPIQLASIYGHLEVVKYLVELGADFKSCNNGAIRRASENKHLRVVKYLVELGADYKKIHSDININDLIILLYNDGQFKLALEIAEYYGCKNDIYKSLKKIHLTRNQFNEKLKRNYFNVTILF